MRQLGMRLFLPTVLLLLAPILVSASAAGPDDTHRLTLRVSGARSMGGNGGKDLGWGGGVALGYLLIDRVSLVAGVARARLAQDGSTFVTTVTPWTVGLEVTPPTQRLINPSFRIGLGLYHLAERGEYLSFFTRRPTQFAESGDEIGLNFAGGVDASVSRRVQFGLFAEGHQSFQREFRSDAPSLGEVQLLNFGARLVHSLK